MDKYIVAPPLGSTDNSIGAEDGKWQKGYFESLPNWQEYLAESTGYGIVSGCEPTINNLTVTVGAGIVHLAGGTRKEIAQTNITLDDADSTNPRIDLVYIDSTGTVAKITGTASATPVVPTLPTDGISVCNATITAGASTGTVNRIQTIAPNLANYGVVNVKDFGAVGDGATDDTSAFRNALLAAQGETLIVPQGEYLINENMFTNNVKKVIDNGVYVNIKPAYKNKDTYLTSISDVEYIESITIDETYSSQGLCYDSKRGHILIASRLDDSTGKILIIDATTYSVINSYSYTNLGHMNTLTYVKDTDEIYCITDSDRYAVINAETMQIISRDNPVLSSSSDSVIGLAYDNSLKLFVGLGYPNTTSNWNLYIYDKNMSLLKTVDIKDTDNSITNRTMNGICVNNGNVFVITFDYLYVFDIFGKRKTKIQYLQGRLGGTEFEDVDIVDDYLIMSDNKLTTTSIGLYRIDKNTKGLYNLGKGEPFITRYNQYGVDFNKYVMPGIYQVLGTTSLPAVNYPTSSTINCVLTVTYIKEGPYVSQTVQILSSSAFNKTYTRQFLGGEWTAWKRIDGWKVRTGNTYVEVTSSEATGHYTATSNGYLSLRGPSQNLYLENSTNKMIARISIEATTSGKSVYVPMSEGQTAYFEAAVSNRGIRFHENN